MAYTIQDVVSDMRVLFPSPDSGITDSVIVRRVNWTVQDIVYRLELPDFFSTHDITLSSGQNTYSLPDRVLKIRSVKLVDEPLQLIRITSQEEAGLLESQEGTPSMYVWEGSQLILYPTPSDAYNGDTVRVRYMTYPAELSSSDEIPLPLFLHEAVRHGTAARLYHDHGEPERAAAETALYLGVINSRRDTFARQSEDDDLGTYPLRR